MVGNFCIEEIINMDGEMNGIGENDIEDDVVVHDNVIVEGMNDNKKEMYVNLVMDGNEI